MRRKKVLSMALALSLCMQLTLPASAGEIVGEDNKNSIYSASSQIPRASGSNADYDWGNADSSPSNADKKATLSNALKKAMFSITAESGYGRVKISWNTVDGASGYKVGVSESADGNFTELASLGAGVLTYTHQTGPDVKRFYKVTAVKDGGSEESIIEEAEMTGLKALQNHAVIHKAFGAGDQSFDGKRVVNLSENDRALAESLQAMDKGTVIVKMKAAGGRSNAGVLLGLKDNSQVVAGDSVLSGNPLDPYKTAAVLLKTDGNIRYSFGHTRANGSSVVQDNQWVTVVFTNAGPDASKVLRLYVGGAFAGSFSGAKNAGFFSKTGTDTANASVTIGGLLEKDGSPKACFKGEIAYVTVTDELLTDEQAQEISQGAGESEIARAFNMNDECNSWVLTGGRNAQGKYEDIGNVRNYTGLFEEVIRWDMSQNKTNGLQRFVINTAKEGYTAASILENYDTLIGNYKPKGVAVMLGREDLQQDSAEVAEALNGLIDRNAEYADPVYTVIQLPVPSADPEENRKIEELSQAVEAMNTNLDSLAAKRVVIIDHYGMMKSMNTEEVLNENGYLNGKGHLVVANQLLGATIGAGSKVTDGDRKAEPVSVPALSQEEPFITIGKDSLTVKIPEGETGDEWTYRLDCGGTVASAGMGREKTIRGLTESTYFELSVVSRDESVRLPVMAGTVGEGETAYAKGDDRELSPAQMELSDRLADPVPMKWLFIGDSITHGAAHTKGYDSVPQLFEKYVREELARPDDVVVNTGVSGATTADFMNHKETRLERYQDADAVIIMFGTNDADNQIVGTGSFRQNLEEMIDEVRANGAIPVIRTPNKLNQATGNRGTNLPEYVAIAREVAAKKDCILADHYKLWEDSLFARSYLNIPSSYWNNDNIHPNGVGQLKMAQDLWKAMGIDRENSAFCTLDYEKKVGTVSKGIIPLVNTKKTSITVNAEYLRKEADAGIFGEVTVKAVSGGVTYSKTVKRSSPTEIKTVTLENLPTGQEYTLTVEAGLASQAKNMRFQTRKFILDGTVNDHMPEGIEGLIWEQAELAVDGTLDNPETELSNDVSIFSSMTAGTLHFRFRVSNPDQSEDAGLQTLFSISNSTQDNTYADFYVQPTSGVIGLEIKGNDTLSISSNAVNVKNTDWHSVTFVMDDETGTLSAYLDGKLVLENQASTFLNIPGANTVRLGNLFRSRGDHLWAFKGDMNLFQVYDRPLTAEVVEELHQATIFEEKAELPDTAVKTDMVDLFYGGYDGSSHYRIPSLLTTKNGVVIAAVDQRRSGSGDQGDIATVIRRSLDGGNTWGEVQNLIDLPYGSSYHSFTIDASMLQDEVTGRVSLLVDMFPESTALMSGSPISAATSGYLQVGKKRYLKLTGADGTAAAGNVYTLRENGSVYKENGDGTSVITEYTVPEHHTGKLYKNGQAAGNIFLYTGNDRGELKVEKTAYLWLITSDDDGATWSNPVCLNGQVKSDWMVFLGTGPGVGIQMKNGAHKGRLVFPVYYTNRNGLSGSQSSAVIYSDDHGATWHMGESPNDGRDGMNTETMNDSSKILTEAQVVEVGNKGRLKLFCRNGSGKVIVATSDDGGATWDNIVKQEQQLYDSYCQMSIIPYPEMVDGKPAYVFSNPASSGRNNGTIRIGLYDEQTDTFDWKYSQLIHPGKYQYSSIAMMPDGKIGVFYEGDQPNMRFTRMTLDWITAPRHVQSDPAITDVKMEREEGGIRFIVQFNRPMIKTGSPVLKLKADGVEKEALYLSGSAEAEYEFFYIPEEGENELEVINVSGGTDSYIGDCRNDLPKNVSFRFSLKEEEDSRDLEEIKENLDAVLNDEHATAEQKREAVISAVSAVQKLSFEGTEVSRADMERFAAIEETYIWHDPNVLPARVDSDTLHAYVRGAALSVPAGTGNPLRAVLTIRDAAMPENLPVELADTAMAVDISLNLEGSSGTSAAGIQPSAPIEIRFELPAGITGDGLMVYHCHGTDPVRIPVRVEGRYGIMTVTELSTFVIGNEKAEEPVDPDDPVDPVDPVKPDKSSGSGSSSGQRTIVDSRTIYGQWILDEKGWWFKQAGGIYPSDTWGLINGKWYHFDGNGYMQTGWLFDTNRKWYYLKSDGSMAAGEWIQDQNEWYYLKEDGSMSAAEWLLDQGVWYYLTENGAMRK